MSLLLKSNQSVVIKWDRIRFRQSEMQNKRRIKSNSNRRQSALLFWCRHAAKQKQKRRAKARADSRQILQQARQKSDETLAQAVVDAESEIRIMRETAAAKKEEAIRIILSELI